MTEVFGATSGGDAVHRLRLGTGRLRVSVLTLGATVQDVRFAPFPQPLVLGAETVADYEGPMRYFGAIVGPVANRIAGARMRIGNRDYPLIANENGRTTLHGGPLGTHHRIWDIADQGPDFAVLTLRLADGDEGFPGNRNLRARFDLTDTAMTLTVTAETDADTHFNLANHSYWNLSGGPDLTGHRLQIAADRYTPVDADLIPTGTAPVDGTAFDFRTPQPLSPDRPETFDHNFCLSSDSRDLAFACRLTAPGGPALTVETTEPGLQIYDASRMGTAPALGLAGKAYGRNAGLAIEAQIWPDAMHHAAFPSTLVRAGLSRVQVTKWQFEQT